ncbi:hypothetical protein KHQ82_02590 [Mycoplasmatota bacterium]|nr:hypothetical protein KHQ82_02590 [Mycoplasmatota bacterium]
MKGKFSYLYANKRTIIGLVASALLITLSIIETYTSSQIATEIKMIAIGVLGYSNVRGVLGRGLESVETFLKITGKAIEEVKDIIEPK